MQEQVWDPTALWTCLDAQDPLCSRAPLVPCYHSTHDQIQNELAFWKQIISLLILCTGSFYSVICLKLSEISEKETIPGIHSVLFWSFFFCVPAPSLCVICWKQVVKQILSFPIETRLGLLSRSVSLSWGIINTQVRDRNKHIFVVL